MIAAYKLIQCGQVLLRVSKISRLYFIHNFLSMNHTMIRLELSQSFVVEWTVVLILNAVKRGVCVG